jgi:hypothetical protein
MLLMCFNVVYTTGNPQYRTALAPGGAGVQTASGGSGQYDPYLPLASLEPLVRGVLDITSAGGVPAPAPSGAVLALGYATASPSGQLGSALWSIANVTAGQYAFGSIGVVTSPGSTASIDDLPVGSGVAAEVVVYGPAFALCTTPTATAIAPGTLLQTDGSGNLQPLQAPAGAPTPVVTSVGTTGATTYTYALVAISANGTYSALGTAASTTTGNAALSSVNASQITWVPVADAAGGYLIVRTAGAATQGVIGRVAGGVNQFFDTGLVAQTGTSATQPQGTLPAPSAPTVTPTGTVGTTGYTYTVASISYNGVWSAASTGTATSTGNATLSTTNYNKITWTVVAGAVRYAIQRSVSSGTPSTTGFIGYATPAQATSGFADYGIPATTYTQNTTPNPTPQPGVVVARALASLAGSTTTPTLVAVWVGGF